MFIMRAARPRHRVPNSRFQNHAAVVGFAALPSIECQNVGEPASLPLLVAVQAACVAVGWQLVDWHLRQKSERSRILRPRRLYERRVPSLWMIVRPHVQRPGWVYNIGILTRMTVGADPVR